MRATLVVLVAAAVLVAALPFAHRADAREGQLAAPRLRDEGPGARFMEWDGESAIAVKGACLALQRLCVGSNETEDGRFFLPAAASNGRIVVSWQAVNDSLRELHVVVGHFEAIGASPIVLEIPSGSAGEYRVHAEPTRDVVGAWEQDVSWSASFLVGEPSETLSASGVAGYSSTTGCALALCSSAKRWHGDPLVVPWRAAGTLVVDWDRSEGERTVALNGTGFAASGRPPLAIPIDGLAAGEYRVEVVSDLALPLARVDVRWAADLAAQQTSS